MGEVSEVVKALIPVKEIFIDPVKYAMKTRTEAKDTYIQSIKDSDDIDPVAKAVLIKNYCKVLKEYENTHDIYEVANQLVKPESKENNNIDPDWYMKFLDSAGKISSEEFQIIWGRILASECNDPGSIPKDLLYVLERMDKVAAENFVKICKTTVQIGNDFFPIIPFRNMDRLGKYGINLDILVDAKALGLIETESSTFSNGYTVTFSADEKPHRIIYCNKNYQYNDNQDEILSGNVIFTRTGKSLYKFLLNNKIDGLGITELDGYWEEICLPQIKLGEKIQ